MRVINLTDTREKMLKGMEICANLVKVTMGAKGRNVVITEGGIPIFTNDGITVLRAIQLEDEIENIGAKMVIQASEMTNTQAGDGTTTTAVLTYAIAKEGCEYVKNGTNPFALSKALQEVGQDMIATIKSQGQELKTKEEVQQIATISAQDEEIGELIANIMDEVGNEGTITVEEAPGTTTTSEIKQGLQFDTGYIGTFMANQLNNDYVGIDVPILVTDKRIEAIGQIDKILQKIMDNGNRDVVIICNEIEEEPFRFLARNKSRIHCVCIKAPGFGSLQRELLIDIATVTGSKFITQESGMKIEDTILEDLGQANKIKSSPNSTVIIGGKGTQEEIDARIEKIKGDIETAKTSWEKEKHQQRVSKISGGIGVIHVGGSTEMEMKNKKYKIEDALNATRSAIQEGIVDGGGMALYRAHIDHKDDEYLEMASKILRKAKEYPFINIVTNAGYNPEEIESKMPLGKGFNAKDGTYQNMIEAGIIDPIKVIRVALENSISSATMLLTTEASITG